jgi:acyl-CoA thioester hydrolase
MSLRNTSPPLPSRPEKRRVPQRADFRFWTEEKLRNPDTDQFRHVNHAAMVSLFEAGRMELFALPQVRPLMQGANLAVVRLLLHFHLELFYPGVVSVGSVIASVGNTSFTCLQGLFIGDECFASAEAVCVLFDPAAGRSHPIPGALRAYLLTPIS